MSFTDDTTEDEIYNALMCKRSKFTIDGIEFKEKIITGTDKERNRKCRARAKELTKILNS